MTTTQPAPATVETGERHWTDGLWGRQIREQAMKRNSPKTTPLPWRWLPNEGQFIVGPDYQIVAEVPCQGANPADGKLIVEAVNSHADLLREREALREALARASAAMALSLTTPGMIRGRESLERAVEHARAALGDEQ